MVRRESYSPLASSAKEANPLLAARAAEEAIPEHEIQELQNRFSSCSARRVGTFGTAGLLVAAILVALGASRVWPSEQVAGGEDAALLLVGHASNNGTDPDEDERPCHTAVEGEICYEHVVWAMRQGLAEHPEWYPQLSLNSTLEEFQAVLHEQESLKCPIPCAPPKHLFRAKDFRPKKAGSTGGGGAGRNSSNATNGTGADNGTGSANSTGAANESVVGLESPSGEQEDGGRDAGRSESVAIPPRQNASTRHDVVDAPCHNALAGEQCHDNVRWAMGNGIFVHPEWYRGLTARSSFKAFQAHLHKNTEIDCPMPCDNEEESTERPNPPNHTDDQERIAVKKQESRGRASPNSTQKAPAGGNDTESEEKCHTAVAGEQCHESVLWAMKTGIFAHPEWYTGLRNNSSFEQFQAHLHEHSIIKCPRPCKPSNSTQRMSAVVEPVGGNAVALDKAGADGGGGRVVCHTAIRGERCHTNVLWAMTDGIAQHPSWYKGLTSESSFEEFQAFLQKDPKNRCPPPCRCADAGEDCSVSHCCIAGGMQCYVKDETWAACKKGCLGANEDNGTWTCEALGDRTPESTTVTTTTTTVTYKCSDTGDDCSLSACCSVGGMQCYQKNAYWAACRETCTPGPDPKDVNNKSWTCKTLGVRAPTTTTTTVTMTSRTWGSPSLFCFSLTRAEGYEPDVMRAQLARFAGIFACDEYTILCETDFTLEGGNGVSVKAVLFEGADVGVSKDGTAGNTELFMHAWAAVRADGRYAAHDWTVKVDPDAVLLPERMRTHLAPYSSESVYLRNCNLYPQNPDFPMMFGAVEAISRGAMELYFTQGDRCTNELPWQAWGEDLFMGRCLNLLGARAADDFKLVADGVCTGANCGDPGAAAFHPFKSVDSWLGCWRLAAAQ